MKPPCGCKPTNVNNYSFEKGNNDLNIGEGIGNERMRPSLVYSTATNMPNIFRWTAPKQVLVWTSSASRANPKAQRTPPKRGDKLMGKSAMQFVPRVKL